MNESHIFDSSMSDRSVVYNNAGVRLLEFGNHSAALELFRGALESKLTQERMTLYNSTVNNNANVHDNENMDVDNDFDLDDMNDQPQRCVSPDESDDGSNSNTTEVREHQSNEALESYLDLLNAIESQRQQEQIQGDSSTPTNISPSPTRTVSSVSPTITTTTAVASSTYEPYLFTIPFLIHENDVTSSSSQQSIINRTQSVSCRIVFNIGLIHQMVCRSTSKVASFYEIAATLLSSLPIVVPDDEEATRVMILLRIAILNNFGVWCYENGEGESMMNSFEQLVETIDDDQALLTNHVDPIVIQGVRANIQAFLTPQNGVSMAA